MSDMHPDNGDGGQGTATNDQTNNIPGQGFQNLAQRQGSADAAGILLYQENFQLREQVRTMKAELEKLQKKLPGKDVTILTADQQQAWTEYQALGTPDEITALKGQVARHARETAVSTAAAAAKFNQAVLLDILPDSAVLSVKSTTDEDGQPLNVAYIKVGEGEEAPLTDYAKKHWTHFLPALAAEPGATQTQTTGTQYIRQQPAQQKPAGKQLSKEERIQSKARSNKLYQSL